MTPEKELEALIVTKLATALPSGVQAVRKQQITTAATLPRVVVACDVSTDDQALAQVGTFSISVEVTAMFDAITGTDPAATIQSTIDAIDETILDWPVLFDGKVICMGGTFGAGSTTNDEDRLVRTISGTLWARRRVVIPGTPSAPTGNIVVSGAGTSFVNDTYAPDGEENGKTKYQGIVKPDGIIYWSGEFWYIDDSAEDPTYFSSDDVTTPDLVTAWEAVSGSEAVLPAPTVTAEMSPTIPPVII
jgi:hypothetical protein